MALIPAGRSCDSEQCAWVVASLATASASCATRSVIRVDGGHIASD
jgi:hypothetical protein